MTASTCLTCSRELPDRTGQPGRPPSYCSKGCRRVAERELLRLDENLTWAENRLIVLRRVLDGVAHESGTRAEKLRERDWWEAERQRLVARQAAVLDAAPETPGSADTPSEETRP